MRLAVFRGGFAFGAAAAVAGADLRTLRRLAGKSLVQALSTDRYEVHELLRQYGEEKLRQTEIVEAVRQAHSAHYLAFLAARDEDIKGRRQQAGLREIRADFENVRQAWLWAVAQRQVDAISQAALECLVNFAEMSYTALDVHAMLGQMITVLQPAAGQPPHPLWEQAVVCREWVRPAQRTNGWPTEYHPGASRERGDKDSLLPQCWASCHPDETMSPRRPQNPEAVAGGRPFLHHKRLKDRVCRPNDLNIP
jgi:hypothetical protein